MSRKEIAPTAETAREPVRPHQPGQAVFRAILPEEIEWKPFAAFPRSARLAIVAGEPLREGPYTIRVKLPRGTKMMPHSHPEDRMYRQRAGRIFTGAVRIDPLFEAPEPANIRGASVTFERPLSPTLKYFSHCGAIAVDRPRKMYFWIFPVAVLGSSLTKVTICGALKCAMFARASRVYPACSVETVIQKLTSGKEEVRLESGLRLTRSIEAALRRHCHDAYRHPKALKPRKVAR